MSFNPPELLDRMAQAPIGALTDWWVVDPVPAGWEQRGRAWNVWHEPSGWGLPVIELEKVSHGERQGQPQPHVELAAVLG